MAFQAYDTAGKAVSGHGKSGWSYFYLPEIHDLHPGMQDRIATLLDLLPEPARRAACLLVVPGWPGVPEITSAQDFCRTLAALPGEKILHGWSHSLGPSFLNWVFYGQDNRSEFAALDEKEARERIMAGIAAFSASFGKKPDWFCAPRWLQNRAATRVLQDCGFLGYMLYDRLQLCSGPGIRLPAVCFDEGRRKLRRSIGRLQRGRRIKKILVSGRPFRLTLHPDDPCDPNAWRQVRELLVCLEKENWKALSLEEVLARRPGSRENGCKKAQE